MSRSAATLASRDRAGTPGASVSSLVRSGLASGGQPLDQATRTWMEPRLAREFCGVRVTPATPAATRIGEPGDRHERQAERFAVAARGQAPAASHAAGAGTGKVDLAAVRVHTNAEAGRSAQSLGALAFASGSHIAFAPGQYAPGTDSGRHVLAHELAHVAQHAGGEADGHTVRRFTAFTADEQLADMSLGWKHPSGSRLRVADDGRMAAEDNGWGPGTSQRAWAEASMIDDANAVLSKMASRARLRPRSGGAELAGRSPKGWRPSALTEVEPVQQDGSAINLASDCGHACREIMGSGGRDVGVIKGKPEQRSGITGGILGGILGAGLLGGGAAAIGYFGGGGEDGALAAGLLGGVIGAVAGAFAGSAIEKSIPGKQKEEALSAQDYQGDNPNTPEIWAEEIYKKEFGANLTRAEAYAAYDALSPRKKDRFDRKYGINKFAVPRVGQGMTIVTEKDMPGFQYTADPDDSWNFHYAAPVLSSGNDYITLESAARWKPDQWIFFMYGPESKEQSFHEYHGSTQTHGNKYTTMVVQPEGR
ncbi:DUF4157 domain-containing protein [Pseudoduganella sp. HUAS MS19]